MAAKIVDAGVDYVRVTSDTPGAQARMLDYFRQIAKRDLQLGWKMQKGGAFGFYGDKTRHALYGNKKDWAMLQASGYEAKSALRLAHDGTQCSRLDLQITWEVAEGEVEKTIRDAYYQACMHDSPERRHMKINMIESRGAAQTVYLGSRASDIFFRIYDKFAESGKEEYRNCVRFELELKGRASKAIWAKLTEGTMTMRDCLGMVVSMLLERGVRVPNDDLQEMDIKLPRRQQTSEESAVAWIKKQVVPTIKRLTESRNWMYAFNTLFDGVISDWERKRMLRSLEIFWGS